MNKYIPEYCENCFYLLNWDNSCTNHAFLSKFFPNKSFITPHVVRLDHQNALACSLDTPKLQEVCALLGKRYLLDSERDDDN